MTTELIYQDGYTYTIHLARDYVGTTEAIKAGRNMLMDAPLHFWVYDSQRVARVEACLRKWFPDYTRGICLDALQYLREKMRSGSVYVVQQEKNFGSFGGGGSACRSPDRVSN